MLGAMYRSEDCRLTRERLNCCCDTECPDECNYIFNTRGKMDLGSLSSIRRDFHRDRTLVVEHERRDGDEECWDKQARMHVYMR